MAKLVKITMQDGKEHSYSNVSRIDDEDKYNLKIYGEGNQPLASLAKYDIKSWYSEEE